MNSGAIAHFSEPGGAIDDSKFPVARVESDEELLSSLNMRGETIQADFEAIRDGGPMELSRGRAAREEIEEVKSTAIREDGRIDVGNEGTVVSAQVADLLHLKGEFIVTNDTESDFAHSLVERATGGEIADTELDLSSFVVEYPDLDIGLGGFYDRDGDVEKGVHIGDLDDEKDPHEFVEDAAINRLGVENFEYRGRSLDFLVTESGYVDIYDNNVGTLEFVRFIDEIITPHISE